MNEQLEHATILMQNSRSRAATAFVYLGCLGMDADNPGVHIVHLGRAKRISEQERTLLKRLLFPKNA